jgi:Methyltransferase domain
MAWVYHNPQFESDVYDPRILGVSAWVGHRKFAYDLVRFMKPNVIVELGAHWGTSFFSFCQAVKDGALPTTCYAVDTWQGDGHAGFYDDTVFNVVSHVVEKSYPNKTTLIRSTFDEALSHFESQSIDLLHIDGFHTLESVTHDYETWLEKMADNSIILFHDIVVRERGFGVYLLWEQLKRAYPSIEFAHSYGLGVLFPKGCNEIQREMLVEYHKMLQVYK